ncbi:LuxR family transcriptional regulator [Methylobacterium tarhaniae]|uniref:LuxR family transcriptional regulator n=1 Tax=Methylobacterium tarhaniae TaxID=1187852 RepID=A0A0J6SHR8_9HYPH|nr:response regulator transcription factor [Methylobacterium tarhaniae]KMO33199.1 LuxR family transcriptional regulator [Methylobacterium tarhaniae]
MNGSCTALPRVTRVLLADDHPLLLNGVTALLEACEGLQVVGQAGSGSQALRLIGQLKPDVAVLDIALPDLHGIAVAKQVAKDVPATRIVMLSAHEDRVYVQQALSAGARGYVLKRSASETLGQAVRAVRSGGVYLDPAIAAHLVTASLAEPASREVAQLDARTLTQREQEVIRLIALGFTTKEAAARLGITDKSVETYKARASDKLGVRSRAKIVQYGILQGWFGSAMS